jgi:hypothetical protein
MSQAPLIEFTTWGALRGRRAFTMMAKPRRWEHGDGRVDVLVPSGESLQHLERALQARREQWPEDRVAEVMFAYRAAYLAQLAQVSLAQLQPGGLRASLSGAGQGGGMVYLGDGAIVCCACGKEDARQGRCHRVWAADVLMACGWRVVVDGVGRWA